MESKEIIEIFSGDDEQLAERVALELIKNGDDTLPLLIPLCQHGNTDVRWWVIRTISGLQTADVHKPLLAGLQDSEPNVRQCAALGLRDHPHPEAIPHLVPLLNSADHLLARLASDALASNGTDAVEPLIQVLESGELHARERAARALAAIRDYRTIPVFFNCLQNGDSTLVEHWADVGLQRMGVGMMFFKPD